jgi:hypothetical protein
MPGTTGADSDSRRGALGRHSWLGVAAVHSACARCNPHACRIRMSAGREATRAQRHWQAPARTQARQEKVDGGRYGGLPGKAFEWTVIVG